MDTTDKLLASEANATHLARSIQQLKDGQVTVRELTQPCRNCHATGTVFRGKTLKVGNSSRCPVCNGSCKVPYEGKQP